MGFVAGQQRRLERSKQFPSRGAVGASAEKQATVDDSYDGRTGAGRVTRRSVVDGDNGALLCIALAQDKFGGVRSVVEADDDGAAAKRGRIDGHGPLFAAGG